MREKMEITYIPTVEAMDMPEEVENYCTEQGWSTHYQNDIVSFEDDGNPFAEWLKANGYVLKKYNDMGIFAT